jgi:hypothetical protein
MAGGRLFCALSKLTMQKPAYFEFPSANLSVQGPLLSTLKMLLLLLSWSIFSGAQYVTLQKINFHNPV